MSDQQTGLEAAARDLAQLKKARGKAFLAIAGALLQGAVSGVAGLAALVLMSWYVLAFSLLLVAVLKPIFPANVGLWLTPTGFSAFGAIWPQPPGQDHLGYTIMPICLLAGILIHGVTAHASRWLLGLARRHFRPLRALLGR